MTAVIAPGVGEPAVPPAFVITPATRATVDELVRTCSPESLRRRFLRPAPLDPEAVLERYRRYLLVGPPAGAAAVALAGSTPVGLLNLVVERDGEVEASLLVADAWQHRHVATSLLTVELGRPRWVGWTVSATVEPGNLPVRQLLARQRLGPCRLVGRDPSAWDYAIHLGEPTASSG
ncbi:N-acetyltransferase [Actinomycetospora sp. TBRC 11914]|uniref:N-acetyltransferase n=1 Tax=Actinomycetospora sp. TBRC 11914 TaxID=2729387 RepID=UPI00145FA74A|nr:N-acetyltransferase [Actinomycetospora sp. TBRC 11914]NMO93196.1 N-acetyltransferase [Actinomycetospora sp. TBRC 11914]